MSVSLTLTAGYQLAPAAASPSSSDMVLIREQAHRTGTVNVTDLRTVGTVPTTKDPKNILHGIQAEKLAKGKVIVQKPGYVPPGEEAKTIVATHLPPRPLSPATGLVLDGASGSSPNPCGCSPPDPNNGVGPNHVFEMVNLAGIIYSKNGSLVKPVFGLDSFFNLPASSMSDPQVMYDNMSGRWFVSIVNIPAGSVVFGVSTSNDPTGTFNFYSVSTGTNLPDQPFIATSNDEFAISVNVFNSRGTVYLGVKWWIMNKSQLVKGSSTIDLVTINPDSTMAALHPARHLSSSSTLYMVTNCTGSCISSPTSTTTTATVIAFTGIPPGPLTRTVSTFSISTSVAPPNADQPGGTALATNDNRILSAVWESNTLWFTFSDACVPTGDTVTRSCIRLVQADTSNVLRKTQDFDYAVTGGHVFFPAVSSYKGQLVVVYGTSSTTIYPSLVVTERLSTDPVNTLQPPVTIRTGTAADTSARYGDYFGAATDPTPTPASVFWVSGEYRASSTPQAWSTAIGEVGSSIITASFNKTSLFQGYQTTTTGSLLIDTGASSINGTASVTTRNQTTGGLILTRTYQLTGIHLFNRTTVLQASFVLDIAVSPYHLSSDIRVNVSVHNVTISVLVARQVDIDHSGSVTIIDVAILAAAYGSSIGSPNYNPLADIDAHGIIDIIDFGILASYFSSPDFL